MGGTFVLILYRLFRNPTVKCVPLRASGGKVRDWRGREFPVETAPSSCCRAPVEPGLNVALVGAVFAVIVAVGGERFPANWTDIVVDSLLFDHLRVGIPPCLPALVGAEPPGLLFLRLNQLFPTLRAEVSLFRLLCGPDASRTISAAETLDCVLGDTEFGSNIGVSMARIS